MNDMLRRLTCVVSVLRKNCRVCRIGVRERPVIVTLIFRIWFGEHGTGAHAPPVRAQVGRVHLDARRVADAVDQVVGDLQVLDVERDRRPDRCCW